MPRRSASCRRLRRIRRRTTASRRGWACLSRRTPRKKSQAPEGHALGTRCPGVRKLPLRRRRTWQCGENLRSRQRPQSGETQGEIACERFLQAPVHLLARGEHLYIGSRGTDTVRQYHLASGELKTVVSDVKAVSGSASMPAATFTWQHARTRRFTAAVPISVHHRLSSPVCRTIPSSWSTRRRAESSAQGALQLPLVTPRCLVGGEDRESGRGMDACWLAGSATYR